MTIRAMDTREVMVGSDFICGVVAVDDAGSIRMSMAAVCRAEVHVDAPKDFATPGARWELMQMMHEQMNRELRRSNVRMAVTWFGQTERFCKRLLRLGWIRSERTSFHWMVR